VAKKRGSPLVRAWFLSLLALAVLYALPSVGYPLGPDQATAFYVSREWWQHNLIPYRDAWDSRIPGIHFVYLLAEIFFGAHPHSIRLLELIVVVASAVAAAQAAARRRLQPWELAPIFLVAVGFYFTFVDYRESAQAEIWSAICLLSAHSTLAVDRNRRKASIVCGLWCGSAVILRPQSVLFLPILYIQALLAGIADRPEPEKAPSVVEITAAYLLGLVQPPAFFAAYFTSRGAFLPFWRVLVAASWHAGPWPGGLRAWAAQMRLALGAAGALWALALIVRARRDGWKGLWPSAIAPLFAVAALLGIWAQGVAHTSRWVVLIPILTYGAADGIVALGAASRALPTLAALALLALMARDAAYRATATRFWRATREDYRAGFDDCRDQELIGERIRQLARESDRLQVHAPGAAAIYASSGLASPYRVFAGPSPEEALPGAALPRFIVERWGDEPARGSGYHETARAGRYVLFERE
jgi:hypothetical protein